MKKRRLLKLTLVVITAITLLYALSISTSAVVVEGKCDPDPVWGDGLTWTFDSESGILEIKGEGALIDYEIWKRIHTPPWYSYGEQIKEVILPKGLVKFNHSAFTNLTNCEKVTIHEDNPVYYTDGNSVIEKATETLVWYCGTELVPTIPSSVTVIGEGAFYKKGISAITIPSSVKKIEFAAFYECYGLRYVTFSSNKNLISIGENAFFQCSKLQYFNIPNSVTYIGERAFNGCGRMTEFKVPSNLTTITESMFQNAGLTEIILHEKVQLVEESAFYGCHELKTVKILNDDLIIKELAFSNCFDLESINLPANMTELPKYGFTSCGSLKSIKIPEGVTVIPENCFLYCWKLESVILPEGLTKIEASAFYSCPKLNITIPKNTSEIDITAFYKVPNAPKVSSDNPYFRSGENYVIDIKNNTLFLGRKVCVIPGDGSVTKIHPNAFTESEVTKVVLPDSITSIEDNIFRECTKLEEVILSQKTEKIGNYSFLGCTSLKTITIPYGVKVIGKGAFSACDSFKKVIIPDSVESIGTNLFSYCDKLEGVTFPKGLTEIPSDTFYKCQNLKKLSIPAGVTKIGTYAFYYCDSLESIEIPESVTYIGDCAFYLCYSLKSIDLPQSVTYIGNKAFSSCGIIKNVTLPSSVNYIGDGAFKGISSLEYFVFNSCPEYLAMDAACPYNSETTLTIIINSKELAERFADHIYFNTRVIDNVAIKASLVNDSVYNEKYMVSEEPITFNNAEYKLFKLVNPLSDYEKNTTNCFYNDTTHWNYHGAKKSKHIFSHPCSVKCSGCNYLNPNIEHTPENVWRYDETSHWIKCQHCNEISDTYPKTEHNWDSGTTIPERGDQCIEFYTIYTCNDCKYEKRELVKVVTVEPTPTPTPTPDETEVTVVPSTPDVTPSVTPPEETDEPPVDITKPEDHTLTIIIISVCTGLLIIAAAVLALPVLKNKKKNK